MTSAAAGIRLLASRCISRLSSARCMLSGRPEFDAGAVDAAAISWTGLTPVGACFPQDCGRLNSSSTASISNTDIVHLPVFEGVSGAQGRPTEDAAAADLVQRYEANHCPQTTGRQPRARIGVLNGALRDCSRRAFHGRRMPAGSMGRRGNPYDNAKAEYFMKTPKVEAVYPMAFETFADENVMRFIDTVCHSRRLYSSLGYLSPATVRGSPLPVRSNQRPKTCPPRGAHSKQRVFLPCQLPFESQPWA